MSSFSLRIGDTVFDLKALSDCAVTGERSVSLRYLSGHDDGNPDAMIELSNFSGTLHILRLKVAAHDPSPSDEAEKRMRNSRMSKTCNNDNNNNNCQQRQQQEQQHHYQRQREQWRPEEQEVINNNNNMEKNRGDNSSSSVGGSSDNIEEDEMFLDFMHQTCSACEEDEQLLNDKRQLPPPPPQPLSSLQSQSIIDRGNMHSANSIDGTAANNNNNNMGSDNRSQEHHHEQARNNAVVSPILPPIFEQEIMNNAQGDFLNYGASGNECSEKRSPQHDNAKNSSSVISRILPSQTADQGMMSNADDDFLETPDDAPFKIEVGEVNDDVPMLTMQQFYSQPSAIVSDDGRSASNLSSRDLGRAFPDEVQSSDDSIVNNSDANLETSKCGATLEESNLSHLEPFVGMRLDVRDLDSIWCPAIITRITKLETRQSATRGLEHVRVTINYDGWSSDWDESISWPSPRLAQIFTHTRELRCMARMIPRNHSPQSKSSARLGGIWPCKVQVRMPNPGGDFTPCHFLRQQKNLFIIPYEPSALPSSIRLSQGGMWTDVANLCAWETCLIDDALSLHKKNKGFDEAFDKAMKDACTKGVLPSNAFECGSLLKREYRVTAINQQPCNDLQFNELHNERFTCKRPISNGECTDDEPPFSHLKKVKLRVAGYLFKDRIIKF